MIDALFPGQGSQKTGMGQFLYQEFSIAKEVFQEADDTLKLKITKTCFEGPEETLQMTEWTQPCLLTVSVAGFKVLNQQMGFKPSYFAGHSLGEYSAAVCAGAISFADALRAVRTRGQAMQKAVAPGVGAMCAVLGLTDQEVEALCKIATKSAKQGVLEPANFNSPGQVVISGHSGCVEWIQKQNVDELLSDAGFPSQKRRVRWIPLKVSAPFHCSLMKPAQEVMHEVLHAISFSSLKSKWVVQNLNANPENEATQLQTGLVQQVTSPVLWTQSILKLKSLSRKSFIEVGSGQVLAGLVKKIDSENLKTFNVGNLEELKQTEMVINDDSKKEPE